MTITVHKGDIPSDFKFADIVAVDTETLGLIPARDPLCLLQFSNGDGEAHLVQFDRSTYDAPNLKAMIANPDILKIFHYARFDISIIKRYLGVDVNSIYCTRTASKLMRTYTDRHGLRECCRELLGVEISKQYQSSDWGADELTAEQKKYAANDVYYLHRLREKLNSMLEREGRLELALKCMDFLPLRAELDMAGWPNIDIFEH